MSEAELMALYKTEKSVMGDNELPGLFMSLLPFILVLAVVVVTSGMGTSTSLSCALLTGVLVIIVTQFKKNQKPEGISERWGNVRIKHNADGSRSHWSFQGPDPGTGFPCCTGVCIKYYTSDLLKDLAWNHDLWSYDWFCDYSGNPVFGELRKTVPCSWREYQCLHRIVVEAGITLNKLPNASPVVMETSVCECTLAESYKHIVLGSTIPCVIAGFIITMMATVGIIF